MARKRWSLSGGRGGGVNAPMSIDCGLVEGEEAARAWVGHRGGGAARQWERWATDGM
jgi:hypothetical protein